MNYLYFANQIYTAVVLLAQVDPHTGEDFLLLSLPNGGKGVLYREDLEVCPFRHSLAPFAGRSMEIIIKGIDGEGRFVCSRKEVPPYQYRPENKTF